MKKIFSIDRVEGDLAVCISDDEQQVICPLSSLGGLTARDVFSAEVDGETLSDIVPMPEERDRRLQKNKERLLHLAQKKNNP